MAMICERQKLSVTCWLFFQHPQFLAINYMRKGKSHNSRSEIKKVKSDRYYYCSVTTFSIKL